MNTYHLAQSKEHDMATITFTGDLAADPEVVWVPGGRQVTRLHVIESRRRQNPDTGEWEDAEPNTYRVQARANLGENAGKSLRQGMTVDVVGHIVTDRWSDKETGETRTSQVVVADSLAPSLKWQLAEVAKAPKKDPGAPGTPEAAAQYNA